MMMKKIIVSSEWNADVSNKCFQLTRQALSCEAKSPARS